jgi:outer membrane protein assembly factor BamB
MVLLAGGATVLGGDWAQFMGLKGGGTSPEKGLLRAWPSEGPKVLWPQPMGAGYGGASIRDGKVCVLVRIEQQKDALRCFNLADGKELWTFDYDAPGRLDREGSRSTPSVSDKHVYIVGPFGEFHCLDIR